MGSEALDQDGYEGTREEMERAIRRLDQLGYVILAAAFLLALAGGGAVAYIVSTGTSLPFRLTWVVISLLLLIVPGVMVFGRDYLRRRGRSDPAEAKDEDGE